MLTGRLWLGAVIAFVGFYALHVPVWGWGFGLVFHMSTDAIGLVVAPLFSEWWKTAVLF